MRSYICLFSLVGFAVTSFSPALSLDFEALFELQNEVEFVGTEETPLNYTIAPLITDDNVFFCAYFEAKVFIFDWQGNLNQILGRKGNGPGEFIMPYGLDIDRKGNLYVNDRNASRIQVFSPDWRYMRTIKVTGNYEGLLISENNNEESLILTGLGNGIGGKSSTANAYDFTGKKLASFGEVNKSPHIAAYRSTQDDQGLLYICNVDDAGVKVFRPDGKQVEQLKLGGPTWKPFEYGKLPNDYHARQSEIRKRQEIEPYTNIIKLATYRNLLFVILRRVNFPESKSRLVLDIFNLKGKPLILGIDLPGGYIARNQDSFYFNGEYDETDWGTIQVKEYKLKEKRLKEALGSSDN